MEDFIYWIWLQQALGFGSNKIVKIFSKIKSLEDFYHSGFSYWSSLEIFNKREMFGLSKSLDDAKKIYEKCCKLGYQVIPYLSDKFSDNLRQIPNPPCVLYVSGQASVMKNKCISIVGSRNATIYGVQMAEEISRELSKFGITIVSGCALGVDSASHRGAISSKGTTIGVVACGLDYPYLVKNASLREKISNFGSLISEYPPGYPVLKYNFPTRNRIISGLSSATIVIEAKKRSGAIITANLAAEQGRDVFVVPVKFDNPLSEGINSLIEDGVQVITCANDILKESFPDEFKKIRSNNVSKPKIDIPEKFKPILNLIGNKKIQINDLKKLTNMSISNLLVCLTEMELLGLVVQFPGKFYKLSIEIK